MARNARNAGKGRKERIALGLPGNRKRVKITLPKGVPVPWGPKSRLRVVGKPVARVDGEAKVTGQARYTTDRQPRGMLYARVLRSPHPSATVARLDTSPAERLPGVKAVVTLDVKEVRYPGQAVAAVAATSPEVAEEALRRIQVKWSPRAFVATLEEARKPDAPPVYPPGKKKGLRGNVRQAQQKKKGDVIRALRRASVQAKGRFRTAVQTHSCLEPHGALALWKGDTLHMWTSTQGTFAIRDELAKEFGLAKDKVRVHCEFMGGGFGSKLWGGDWTLLAARLAKEAGAPVRLILDRAEEHQVTGNRPDSLMEVTGALASDGTLTALRHRSWGTAGVGDGAATSRPATRIYRCPNLEAVDHEVYTNHGAGRPFRAPGHPQGCFSLEQVVDMLAEAAGLDPVDLRLKNDPHPVRRAEIERGAELFQWRKRRGKPGSDPGPVKRGLGMASGLWYSTGRPPASARVEIDTQGRVSLYCGGQDLGTGTRTILAQVVAEELGLKTAEIRTHIGDTKWPYAPSSGGSKTAPSLTPVFRTAAYQLKQRLFKEARGQRQFSTPAPMVALGGQVYPQGKPDQGIPFAVLAKALEARDRSVTADRAKNWAELSRIVGGVQFAEVTVDVETGIVQVKRVLALQDAGRIVNRDTAMSQLYGGVIQGVSYALFEERVVDSQTGKMINANLEQYKIAGARDVPRIDGVFMDVESGQNTTGVVGIGEPVTVPTAAAIANAVYNATGKRMFEIPLTPTRVLEALQRGAS